MKSIDPQKISLLPGIPLKKNDSFKFRCHSGLACFNQCCRNLNLFLYPYDVLRLRKNLKIDSDRFLDTHVDVVLREGNYFPDILLRMAGDESQSCPFLSEAGCAVYPDRPGTCRSFPVEHTIRIDARPGASESVSFFRPPVFCQGRHEDQVLTVSRWAADQDAGTYNQMTLRWGSIKARFEKDPWGPEGLNGARGKMAFMAAYNLDRFRDFVFQSTFLKRYRVKRELVNRLRVSDRELLLFGFEWIRYFVWGLPTKSMRP
ncbi:YkgJ family cysteine cluster protein [Desulfosarcina sp.]|uniref:YkgJ family cysteine cluster protein n=1 Tax=Desulfosarcina sp. TaxID=2027861 RepID=UPI003971050B